MAYRRPLSTVNVNGTLLLFLTFQLGCFFRKAVDAFSPLSRETWGSRITRYSPRAIGLDASPEENTAADACLSLESLAQQLHDLRFQNVVVVVGAGASVSAGIPDFRTPGTGLYDNLQKYNLPFPEAVFDLGYYQQNPQPFIELCETLWPGQEGGPRPTLVHSFLALLQEKNALRRVYTQNIDGLEALAGVNVTKLVECHGHFRTASCTSCRTEANVEACMADMLRKQAPKCSTCGGLVKPDVVFFGEELPLRYQNLITEDVTECDLLIVIGTSLLVMPVAAIPQQVSKKCPRLLLNRELVGDFLMDKYAYGSRRTRDVFEKGDCDDAVRRLCKLASWEQKLDELHSAVSSSRQA